ncbi:uncharacterized protein BDZ99DRAFT_527871 [Mytilinidion resinicola]|uniref:Uncharacterized protein n=1 Tax=Mytilinidion resinicola TaxID=574789 RepID=A0A6A6Y268_9PEZI|nr:uncharacterized protein BDZ99DRAFT_527871 [Mytilinidion resinicola]KAF2801907.1 hypothetical protein BDZ99DRAFT_527871 [Mytilinidion resinicola]
MRFTAIALAFAAALTVSAAPSPGGNSNDKWSCEFDLQNGGEWYQSGYGGYGDCHKWGSNKKCTGAYMHKGNSKAKKVYMYKDKNCQHEIKECEYGQQQWWKDEPMQVGSYCVKEY